MFKKLVGKTSVKFSDKTHNSPCKMCKLGCIEAQSLKSNYNICIHVKTWNLPKHILYFLTIKIRKMWENQGHLKL